VVWFTKKQQHSSPARPVRVLLRTMLSQKMKQTAQTNTSRRVCELGTGIAVKRNNFAVHCPRHTHAQSRMHGQRRTCTHVQSENETNGANKHEPTGVRVEHGDCCEKKQLCSSLPTPHACTRTGTHAHSRMHGQRRTRIHVQSRTHGHIHSRTVTHTHA
jgi:hypothetical protein